MRRRWVVPVAVVATAAVLLTVVIVLLNLGSPGSLGPRCTVAAPPNSPELPPSWTGSPEQMDNAATIVGVGRRLNLPDRAVTIALATAIQESGLANLRGGDRDSVGLFQQRPSQGWGDQAQLNDTVYATTAFYDALVAVPGWSSLDVTQAAQRVQRSGFPEAYADHEPEARVIAVALLGQAPAALTCADVDVTTPATDTVAGLARRETGNARLSGAQPPQEGWAIASWLVGHAKRLALDRVTYDGRTWTADGGTWTTTGAPDGRLALHRVGDP